MIYLFISTLFCQKSNAIPDIIKHEIRNLEESSGVSSMSSDKKKEADKRKSGSGGIKR